MPSSLWQYWRGPPGWNSYFLVRFGLLWVGYSNFHPFLNLVFAAFLLMPIPRYSLRRLRHWITLSIGFASSWHDTWLPGPESTISQGSQVAESSTDYLANLVTRFTNWQMIGVIFALFVAWLFLSQWVRVTVFVVAIPLWLNVLTLTRLSLSLWPAGQPTTTTTMTGGNTAATVAVMGGASAMGDIPAQTAPPTTANLNTWLNNFYNAEAKRKSIPPSSLPVDVQSSELLVISICSLPWSDIGAVGSASHSLWSHFDIEFKNFSSATPYGDPVAIHLLYTSCGQTSRTNPHQPVNNDCYLFDNLSELGLTQYLMMGHNGQFGGSLKEVRENGGMQNELTDQTSLPVILLGSDGSSVYNDTAVLNRWLDVTEKNKNSCSATFYNTFPLRSSNRRPGISKAVGYKA